MIFRNYFVINLVLLVLIILLGVKAFSVITYSADMRLKSKVETEAQESVSITPKSRFPAESVFEVISARNIFNPSRRLTVKKTGRAAQVSKDAPQLFGTIITGEKKSALLKDPGTRATKSYYINDAIGSFVVTDIQEDRVILSRGDETVEIKLREPKGTAPSPPPERRRRQTPAPRLQKKKPA